MQRADRETVSTETLRHRDQDEENVLCYGGSNVASLGEHMHGEEGSNKA